MKKVKLIDPTTGNSQTVPVTELAPGFVRAEGPDGESVYVPAKAFKFNTEPLHPPFPDYVREHLRRITTALNEVHPETVEECERGLRCECNPDRELRVWLWIAEAYSNLVSGRELSAALKGDYYRLCLNWSITRDLEGVIATTQLEEMERNTAREVLSQFPRSLVTPSTLLIVPPLHFEEGIVWDFTAVQDFAHFKELWGDAQIIVAVDTRSNTCRSGGLYHIAFGHEEMQEIVASGVSRCVSVVMFAVDFHIEHEVYQFLAAVRAATGYLGKDFTIDR
jgi:hypothetical protein